MNDIIGLLVDVYRNSRKECWSVRAAEGKQKGKVIAHADSIDLENCKFIVQEGGRQRVLREGRKNVHAWIRGRVTNIGGEYPSFDKFTSGGHAIKYNPYKMKQFCSMSTGKEIFECRRVALFCRGVIVASHDDI